MLTQKFDRVKTLRQPRSQGFSHWIWEPWERGWTLRRTPNNTQQQVTTCNRVCKRTCASASVFFLLIDMNTWQWDSNMCFESLRWGQCSRFDSRLLDRTQHVTSNNAGSCWPTVLPSSHGTKNLLTRKQFVKFSDYHEQFRLGYQPLTGKWAHALPALLLRSLLGAGARERRKSSIPQAIPFAGRFFCVKKCSFDAVEKSNCMPLNLPWKVSESDVAAW